MRTTAIDERQRHALYERLGVGRRGHQVRPPPARGTARLRFAHADLRLGAGLAGIRTEMANLRVDLERGLRRQLWAILGGILMAVLLSELLGRI